MADQVGGARAPRGPVRLGGRRAGPPVRTGWGDVPDTGPATRLDELADVDAPAADIGVLTRETPGGVARFEPLPDPPAPPPLPQRHVQNTPAQRWQITHNRGDRPHFEVHDGAGRPHRPEDVEHPVPGVISEIVFGLPMLGTADPS